MGLSISCPFADYDDLDEHIESLTVKSFSFKDDSVKTIVRSVSFKKGDSETKILKSLGSGKMIIEGSVSFRGLDPFNLETMVSIKAPSLSTPKDNAFRPASFKGRETENQVPVSNTLIDANPIPPTAEPSSPKHEAAVKLQKVYKSFRTRRRLADCAVLAEQCWWKLLDFAELKRSSISFFHVDEPETAVSRWSRARTRVAKVGKGLSKDEKARQLALQHWLEAIDPRHRYGHNLHFYYENWLHCESRQPFFYWLDVGEGKEVNLERCPRSKLQKQCIKYLGPKEREAYEVIVEDGKFVYKKNGKLLDTSEGDKDSKWIFVLSTSKVLYVGKKKKGKFQHSSFLAGGATSAAGRLVVENGILKAVWPHSGHYRPTKENFQEFMNFLREKNVDLTHVKIIRWGELLHPPIHFGTQHMNGLVLQKESPVDEDDYSLSKQSSYSALRSSSSERDLGRVISNMAINNTNSECDFELKQSQAIKNESRSIHLPKITHPFERSENEDQVPADSLVESHLDTNETLEESSTPKQHYKLQKRNLFEEDREDEVPPESILRRINSHKGMELCQLGKQLSCKWTTGAGPRIGCVRDYPTELQFRALEQVNLSPRSAGNSRACSSPRNMMSPRPKTLIMSLLKENKSSSSFCDPPAPFQC